MRLETLETPLQRMNVGGHGAIRRKARGAPGAMTMAVRPILKMGDPRLLRVAQPVTAFDTPELRALVADLFDTMRAANGAGLAAPQIGVDLQLVIFGFTQNPRYPGREAVPETVLLNPVITPLSDERVEGWEGCLSVPGLRGLVPRHAHIRYCGQDVHGRPIEREATGFHAVVVQHECDHLIGRLYPTRMTDLTKLGYTEVLFPELAGADDD
jgi:peptide deformylase